MKILFSIKRKEIMEISIFSLIVNVLLLVIPLYTLQIYERIIPTSNLHTLLYISIAVFLSILLMSAIEVIRSIYCQRVAAGLDKKLAETMFRAEIGASSAHLVKFSPLRDLLTVRSFIASKGVLNFFDLPFAPLFLVLLYFIHPVLFFISILGVILMLVLVIFSENMMKSLNIGLSEASRESKYYAQSCIDNKVLVRSNGMVENAIRIWGHHYVNYLASLDQLAKLNAIMGGISRFVRTVLQIAILGAGGYLVIAGEMVGGMIFAASIVSGKALQPFDQLIAGWRQRNDALQAWRRLEFIINSQKTASDFELPSPKGTIKVQNLIYKSPLPHIHEGLIIKNINLTIEQGEMIILTGPSAVGKSVFAKLLIGALSADSGSVSIDDVDLKRWSEKQLGKAMGYLSQDSLLLPGTIAENIARFDPHATNEAVVAAALLVQAHELIMQKPDGYQTRVDNLDKNIAHGLYQQIGLARAFYGEPQIIVLDDPTVKLDENGMIGLQKAIIAARERGATIVIVTHNMALTSASDKILAMRDGQIISVTPNERKLKKTSVHSFSVGQSFTLKSVAK